MAGDCNTKLSPLDKQGRLTWKETKYRNSLIHFLKEIKLGDIYGEMHPKKFLHVRIKATEVKIQHSFFFFIKGKYKPDINDFKVQRRDGNENVA